jgi:hypothetical protein
VTKPSYPPGCLLTEAAFWPLLRGSSAGAPFRDHSWSGSSSPGVILRDHPIRGFLTDSTASSPPAGGHPSGFLSWSSLKGVSRTRLRERPSQGATRAGARFSPAAWSSGSLLGEWVSASGASPSGARSVRFAESSFGRSRDPPRDATLRGRQRDAIRPSNWSSIWSGILRGSPSGALLREAHQAASSFGSRCFGVRMDGHDSVALDAAFAAPPDARNLGPEQKAAASGNRCQAWPRRDDRPPIRFEDNPVFALGTSRRSFGSRASGLLMMKGAGWVNADARRATVSPAPSLRTRGWTTHRLSSPCTCRSIVQIVRRAGGNASKAIRKSRIVRARAHVDPDTSLTSSLDARARAWEEGVSEGHFAGARSSSEDREDRRSRASRS